MFTLPDRVNLNTLYGQVEYGISDRLAVDIISGYNWTSFANTSNSGSGDTTLGLRYQLLRGEHWVLTGRIAGTLAGSYPRPFAIGPIAAGDKASGGEASVLAGTTWRHGIYGYAETGYRHRGGGVPSAFFGTAGLGQRVRRVSYGATYQQSRNYTGIDIFGPGFTPELLRYTKQILGAIDGNVGYTTRNGVYLGFDAAYVVHGRNVGQRRIFAVTVGYTLPGFGPHL